MERLHEWSTVGGGAEQCGAGWGDTSEIYWHVTPGCTSTVLGA